MALLHIVIATVCFYQLARVSSEDFVNSRQLASKLGGAYCGAIHGDVNVEMKLTVKSTNTVDIEAKVYGLILVCENEPYEMVDGEFKIPQKQSCVRQQLENFDQSLDNFHLLFQPETDVLTFKAPKAKPVKLTHGSCAASSLSRRLMKQPSGTYCGKVQGDVTVDVKFTIKDEFHSDVTAEVYGLQLVCENETFELDEDEFKIPSSVTDCVRTQFSNFDQNPANVHVKYDAKGDQLTLTAPAVKPTSMTHEACKPMGTLGTSTNLLSSSRLLSAKPRGTFCGVVTGDVAVTVKMTFADNGLLSVRAEVYGLVLECENEKYQSLSSGEMKLDQASKANSCIRGQFVNFDQDPDNVKVTYNPARNAVQISAPATKGVDLTPEACSSTINRRLQKASVFV